MRIKLTYSGDTLTVSPLAYRERLPYIMRLEKRDGVTYAISATGEVLLGTIPDEYKLERLNKYNEIIFRSKQRKPRKTKKYSPRKKTPNA